MSPLRRTPGHMEESFEEVPEERVSVRACTVSKGREVLREGSKRGRGWLEVLVRVQG